MSHTQDNKEELRTDAEQNVAKFIEVAKQMETFFLQRRLQLSVLKPEQLIKEVIAQKQELNPDLLHFLKTLLLVKGLH